jgi:hypothetical protein
MNTANMLASHLNPQQIRLLVQSSSTRKRWIWSQQEDHLHLLSALAANDVLKGKPVVIWYDDETAASQIMQCFPLAKLDRAIYTPLSSRSNHPENVLNPLSPAESIHHIELYKLSGDYERISKPWASLHEELWPGTNRYDLIQKFAGLFNHNNINPLFYKLSRSSFEISPAEYKKLRHKIEHHIKLDRLRQDGFEYMDLLDVNLLINHSLDFVKSEVMQYISLMTERATELLKRSDWIMLRYFNYVKTYWIREIHIYVNKINKLLSHARELHLTYGEAFSFESSMSQLADKLKGQISRKAKMISQDRKAIKTQYLELLAEIEAGQPWVTVPAERKENVTLNDAVDYLQILREELLNAKDSIETQIRSQLKRLNSHNAPAETGLGHEIKEWEEDVLKWYNEVNISGYFKKRFESQALSIHRSVENLREVNDALTAIVERQHYLEDYFFWAGFQNQFPEVARTIIQSLHLVPSADWLLYFDEWYITQLVTGDALEVAWPEMMNENMKDMIEKIRFHTIAEYLNELNHRRTYLCEQEPALVRRLTARKGGIESDEAERYFLQLGVEERSKWYPIQLLPLSMMTLSNANAEGVDHFVLMMNTYPMSLPQWNQIQEMNADVFAWAAPVNQRYQNEQLDMPAMMTEFRLAQSRNSTALKYMNNLARQFAPFLSETCIYSAHRVNVISFLGADLDRMVLDQLPMPYKISERSLNPDENFLIEALLEPNKPFVLLVRDYWPTGAWPENSLWHLQFQEDIERAGIKVIHSWSQGWLNEAQGEVGRVRDEILQYVGNSYSGITA